MAEWFVYLGPQYYPWAEIVEAETAEDAAAKHALKFDPGEGLCVFPLDAMEHSIGGREFIEEMRREGARSQ